MPDALDPYSVLGVSPSATPAEVTHAYRQKVRAQHPDTRGTQSAPVADEQLQRLLAAYTILRDPLRRAAYDARTTTKPGAAITTRGPQRVDISVTYNARPSTESQQTPPLWAGPVRRHR